MADGPDVRTHQIGEVAEAVGLSLRTIRHYDEVGIVVPSARSAGGFRLYTDADVDRLRMVKRMKPLDLSLEEIRDVVELLDALADPEADTAGRDRALDRLALYAALAEERCERLRQHLAQASEFTDALRRAVDEARAGRPAGS
jgi:DNA-binding transcriptional MerR regulator